MDKTEFEESYKLYFGPLCMYAIHYVSDASAAKDIVQDSFLSVYDSYVSGEPLNHIAGTGGKLLFTIVRNRCLNYLKKYRPARLQPMDADSVISDEEAYGRSFDESRLWTAIERLPEQQRKSFLMSKRDGMAYKEIAEELGLSVFTVRNHVSLALMSLKKISGLAGMELLILFFLILI